MRWKILALALSFLLFVPFAAWAVPSSPWRLLVTDLPPFSLEKQTDAPGVLVELVREMAHRSGQDVRVEFMPWTRAQIQVQRGTHMLILPLTRTPDREHRYRWLVPLYGKHFVFLALRNKASNTLSVERLRNERIGVLRSAPEIRQLRSRGFTQIIEAESVGNMVRMLKLGMIAALYGDEVINRFSLQRSGLGAADLAVSAPLETGDMWLGGSKDISDTEIELWQDALAKIRRDKTLDRIFNKYHLKELSTQQ